MLKNCLCGMEIISNITRMSWLYTKTIAIIIITIAWKQKILFRENYFNVCTKKQRCVFWYESAFFCFEHDHVLTVVVFNLMKDQKRQNQLFISLCEPPCISNYFLILRKKTKVPRMGSDADKDGNNLYCLTDTCLDLAQPREEKDNAGIIAQIMQCNTA